MKYEYKIWKCSLTMPEQDVEDFINELGEATWKLVSVVQWQRPYDALATATGLSSGQIGSDLLFIFVRERKE